ncbi:glycosyltransferase, partial [Bacteroidota bacterium]
DESGYRNIVVLDFIKRMDMAYAVADIIISRAGAGTISELCLVGKPVILVPSPNVAEDHQTKNALALVNKNAAIMIKDIEAKEKLIGTALELIKNDEHTKILSENIKGMALRNSAKIIAEEVIKLS